MRDRASPIATYMTAADRLARTRGNDISERRQREEIVTPDAISIGLNVGRVRIAHPDTHLSDPVVNSRLTPLANPVDHLFAGRHIRVTGCWIVPADARDELVPLAPNPVTLRDKDHLVSPFASAQR